MSVLLSLLLTLRSSIRARADLQHGDAVQSTAPCFSDRRRINPGARMEFSV